MVWKEKLRYAACNPAAALLFLKGELVRPVAWAYDFLAGMAAGSKTAFSESAFLAEIRRRSRKRSHLSDHLVTLFTEAVSLQPRLIVELGVGEGESTFVLERVARLCGSTLVSVDKAECPLLSSYAGWIFVQSDDLEFGARFQTWCRKRGLEPSVDILFVDTSHLFEHTVREIERWFPHLAKRARVFFHDTNLKKVCFRKDGRLAFAWDNQRGVIAAIEKHFGKSFDETKEFEDAVGDWKIRHYPYCAGLTVLERVDSTWQFPPAG